MQIEIKYSTKINALCFLFILCFTLPAIATSDVDEFGKKLDSLHKNKKYDEMISMCNKAIKIGEPKFKTLTPIYYSKGCAYYGKTDYDQAIADFKKAIKIKPKYGYGFYMLSCCYEKKGQRKEAVDAIKQAYMYSPSAKHIKKKYQQLTTPYFIHPLNFKGSDAEKNTVIAYIEKSVKTSCTNLGINDPATMRIMEKQNLDAFKTLTQAQNRKILDMVLQQCKSINISDYATINIMYNQQEKASKDKLSW